MDPMAPALDHVHARPRLPRRHPGQPGKRHHTQAEAGTGLIPRLLTPRVLIRHSPPPIRGLLAATAPARDHPGTAAAIARHLGRRSQPTHALISHYRRP